MAERFSSFDCSSPGESDFLPFSAFLSDRQEDGSQEGDNFREEGLLRERHNLREEDLLRERGVWREEGILRERDNLQEASILREGDSFSEKDIILVEEEKLSEKDRMFEESSSPAVNGWICNYGFLQRSLRDLRLPGYLGIFHEEQNEQSDSEACDGRSQELPSPDQRIQSQDEFVKQFCWDLLKIQEREEDDLMSMEKTMLEFIVQPLSGSFLPYIFLNRSVEMVSEIFSDDNKALTSDKLEELRTASDLYRTRDFFTLGKLGKRVEKVIRSDNECDETRFLSNSINVLEKELLNSSIEYAQQKTQEFSFDQSCSDIEKPYLSKGFECEQCTVYIGWGNQTEKSSPSLLQQKIVKIEKRNANLEDIFFVLQNLSKNPEKYLVLWREDRFSFDGRSHIRCLNLCNPDSWFKFIAESTEFFNTKILTPLYEQISQSKQYQDIILMKISFGLDSQFIHSNLLHRQIQKLPKKQSNTRAFSLKGKRSYRKKSKYWDKRKNPIFKEIADYSKELMTKQKDKE